MNLVSNFFWSGSFSVGFYASTALQVSFPSLFGFQCLSLRSTAMAQMLKSMMQSAQDQRQVLKSMVQSAQDQTADRHDAPENCA